jgi:DNA mismatch repair protein MutL
VTAVIRQLPPALVNRIAAGEVIERPASVVKELLENALDAGARRIEVEIEDGGKQLIRVRDDGGGITPADLPLAFASHATSKIRSDEDLFNIATMGFRGEALASIGSVSFARIISRTPDAEGAHEIENRGGAISHPRVTSGNPGTTIEVRDLFFNVPVRRKFLKTSSTETGHVADAILRIALSRPDVAFRLTSNGRITLDLPVAPDVTRWLHAWPDDYAGQKLDLDAHHDRLSIRGIVGLPALAQPHAKHQYVFVNGRFVRDKFVGHALKEAFRGLIEPGRNPACVLMIDMPPDQVDVNVHPTKIEVRFRDSSRIHGFVLASVRELLRQNDIAPTLQATPSLDWREPQTPGSLNASDGIADRDSLRAQLADFFRQGAHAVRDHATAHGAQTTDRTERLADGSMQMSDASGFNVDRASSTQGYSGSGGSFLPSASSVYWSASPEGASVGRSDGMNAARVDVQPIASLVPAIQLHNSYLVVESEDGLAIIDQHALHERILFEELLTRLSRGPLESQRLLLPITLAASPQQIDCIEALTPMLDRLGIEVVPIGPEAVAIHAFPSFLDRLDPASFVADLLDRAERDDRIDHEALMHEVLDMMACKAAIKAGDPLTPQEIKSLLEHRATVNRTSNCPHGRPTTLKLTLKDLEKQFKRTGF